MVAQNTLDAGGKANAEQAKPASTHRGTSTGGFAKADVANLSKAELEGMSHQNLIRVIQAADVALFRGLAGSRLEKCDKATLVQLAFLARRTVRHQGY